MDDVFLLQLKGYLQHDMVEDCVSSASMSCHVLGDDSVCFDVMPFDLQLSVMCHWHTAGCYFLLCSEADLPLL